MDLYLKFKEHSEGFYSDRTIQIYIKSERLLLLEQKKKA